MQRSNLYLVACLIASLMPILTPYSGQAGVKRNVEFAGWPTQLESKTLTSLPLTALERQFAADFPGRIGRFSDGEREIVVRWVTEATRQMHFASDCFQAIGYTVKPLPVRRDEQGSLWASFEATKDNERLRVYERINNDAGESWTDVSAWYWSALRHEDRGPWWAITIAEKER